MEGESSEPGSIKMGRWLLFGAPAVGALTLVIAATAFAGVIDMGVVNICLWGAWILGTAGTWLEPDVRKLSGCSRTAIALLVALILGAALFRLHNYLSTYMQTHDSVLVPPQLAVSHAEIGIDLADPEALGGGEYYLPVDISDSGGDVHGYVVIFEQRQFAQQLTIAQQEAFMAIAEKPLRSQKIKPEVLQDGESYLDGGTAKRLRETKQKITQSQLDAINHGRLFPYYGVVFVYSDDETKRDHSLKFAERCAYFDGNIKDYIDCAGHNFSKKIWR